MDQILAGRRTRGLGLAGFEVIPCLPTAVGRDVRAAADQLRCQYDYLMGSGDPETNFHCALARRMGFGGVVQGLREALRDGGRYAAGEIIPVEFIDATGLIGDEARIALRMSRYAEAGATTRGIMVSAADTTREGRIAILETCAKAAARGRQPRRPRADRATKAGPRSVRGPAHRGGSADRGTGDHVGPGAGTPDRPAPVFARGREPTAGCRRPVQRSGLPW